VYIGDSAPLSYLQTVRQLVSSVMGTSALTVDPHRHTILEASVQTPPTYRHTYTLPDREAGFYLVDSFFANVSDAPIRRMGHHLMPALTDQGNATFV
jgi:hypothetical protein